MQSKTTRIAYLKRMFKRLEGEDARIQQLVLTEGLSPEAEKILIQQVKKSRDELLAELQNLQRRSPDVQG